MLNFFRSFHHNKTGFTLVELVVIAILGILAAVVVPNVGRLTGEVRTEAMDAELHSVNSAMQTGMIENNLTQVTAY